MNQEHYSGNSWEEIASEYPRNLSDTDRFVAILVYRAEHDNGGHGTDQPTALRLFQRARWGKPSNLSATANHAASKGWVTQVGQDQRRKLWQATNKGRQHLEPNRSTRSQGGENA